MLFTILPISARCYFPFQYLWIDLALRFFSTALTSEVPGTARALVYDQILPLYWLDQVYIKAVKNSAELSEVALSGGWWGKTTSCAESFQQLNLFSKYIICYLTLKWRFIISHIPGCRNQKAHRCPWRWDIDFDFGKLALTFIRYNCGDLSVIGRHVSSLLWSTQLFRNSR